MKKIISLSLALVLLSGLAACRFPAPTTAPYRPPTEISLTATTNPNSPLGGDTPYPQPGTATQPIAVTATSAPKPSATATTKSTQPAPTKTKAPTKTTAPSTTPVPTYASIEYDPHKSLGKPTISDPLDTRTSLSNWGDQQGRLPNSAQFQINIVNGKYYVTGLQPGFSTWWFTWPEPKNLFLELVVDSQECVGKDAYGVILRGPVHQAGKSYGYVAEISCDGNYRIFRLDSANPWTIQTLVDWTASDLINSGPFSVNILGVQMIDDKMTVFINNKSVADVQDNTYASGRYGLFVGSDDSHSYTYYPQDLYYWEIKK